MSTKTSLEYYRKEVTSVVSIHIYKEMLDGKYYIETETGRLQISKEVAEGFAKVLTEYNDVEDGD